ncbi:MAG: hypothetical protein QG608_3832 [Actinomycetota bacterium]|nr:hypothetical protein [Actinomycetota bacterium]
MGDDMTFPRHRTGHPLPGHRPRLQRPLGLLALTTLALAATGTGNADGTAQSDPTRAASLLTALPVPTVTPDQIRRRAASWQTTWHNGPVPYLSSVNPTDWFQGYRRDCSGYVSMVLGLPGPGLTTGQLAGDDITVPLAKDDLRLGDLMINPGIGADGHVVIFDHWTDETRRHYVGHDLSGSHGTRTRVLPYPYTDGYPMTPHRYRGTQPTTRPNPTTHLTLTTPTTLQHTTTRPTTPNRAPTGKTWHDLPTPPATPTTALASATSGTTTHLLALAAGRLWHVRSTGTPSTWGRWAPVDDQAGELPGTSALAVAVLDGDVHLMAVHEGRLSRTVHRAGGSWEPWQDLQTTNIPDVPATVTAVALTVLDRELHVTAVRDGALTHTRRTTEGIWQPWEDLPAPASPTGTAAFTAVASTSHHGQLHLVAVRSGTVYALQRDNATLWTTATPLHPAGAPTGVTDLATASTDGHLDVIAAGQDGPVALTRDTDGPWSPWSALPGRQEEGRVALALSAG